MDIQVTTLINNNDRTQATKLYRELHNCSLSEAFNAIDDFILEGPEGLSIRIDRLLFSLKRYSPAIIKGVSKQHQANGKLLQGAVVTLEQILKEHK